MELFKIRRDIPFMRHVTILNAISIVFFLLAVLFHLTANVGNEIFATHPDSKVIQTAMLLVLVAWLVWRERALFFAKPDKAA